MSQSKNEPAARVKLSSIQASVWRNQSPDGKTFYSTTFDRRYKDKDGAWKSSDSFSGDQLLLLAKAADLAHTEEMKLRAADRGSTAQPDAEAEAA